MERHEQRARDQRRHDQLHRLPHRRREIRLLRHVRDPCLHDGSGGFDTCGQYTELDTSSSAEAIALTHRQL
jgi:hypothetical protein